ncbi:PAS domain S-box-containing protein [Desulfotomaculum arcticum]|uniref:PAS domain S-box-containing protein n=1 Tax=Desulfotruncus arcticus DSM 17038 TaxID=1121424 RepID=A0A1I2U958_9FIRM|nr:sigma 54-interacting transcriptional regulator [Desulfotruncus arcticus]SFG72929.1 PAS domain S-box-containing protein [Desulfotomaculum arcticum] [Desulfotruncus arcticus DSM 17038]
MSQTAFLTVADMLCRNFIEAAPAISVGEGRAITEKKPTTRPFVLIAVHNKQIVGVVRHHKLFNAGIDPDASISEVMDKNFLILDKKSLKQDILNYVEELRAQALIVIDEKNKVLGVLYFDLLFAGLLERYKITRARLEAVLDTVEEAITIINDQDVVTHWNHRAEALYDISAEKIVGNNIEKYFSNLMVTKVFKERTGVRAMYHQPCADTHVLISANPVKIGDQVVGGVSSERDITEVVELSQKLNQASSQVHKLKKEIKRITGGHKPFARIKGHHYKLKELVSIAKKVAVTHAAVLIRGESGTGKELFARAIHEASGRADKPFVVVNCAAIPPTLFESEVFGYEAGAFTGASRHGKPGFFENANGGTLFLDEVAELPTGLQVKLLRVLQDQVFRRVGGSAPIKVDVRIVAATNRNLEEMLVNELFREDLYYRLNVVSLEVPPLRERREDIPELVYQFIQEYSQLYRKRITRLDPEAMAVLLAYPWPGNVREMKNSIERMVIMADGEVITGECIPAALKQNIKHKLPYQAGLVSVTEQTEREIISRTLQQTNGNRSQAARMLGIPRSTLYYKMHQLGLMK